MLLRTLLQENHKVLLKNKITFDWRFEDVQYELKMVTPGEAMYRRNENDYWKKIMLHLLRNFEIQEMRVGKKRILQPPLIRIITSNPN